MSDERSVRDAAFPLLLYNLFYPLVLLVMLPGFILRMLRRGQYRHKFGQRFGIYSTRVRQRVEGRGWTWVHAVSVGEVLIALKLIDRMKADEPDVNVVLATTTSTGFALARKTASDRDWMEVIYNPLDFIVPVRRALNLFHPRRLILVEAEVWPNMVSQAHKRGARTALVNARLSPRSESRFRRFRAFTGPIYRLLDLICVQEPEDVDRWLSLGVSRNQLRCTGSIKYDEPPAKASRVGEFREIVQRLGVHEGSPVLLGGSTFPGEEKVLGQVFKELRATFPDLFLILVPRHVERTREVVADLKALEIPFVLRADLAKPPAVPAQCLVVNTTGELRDWYHVATVVFIGKSLKSTGGQNPVEAVMAGKPVLYGPHMENFRSIVEKWRTIGAAIQVANSAELQDQIARLLTDPGLREKLASTAREAVMIHHGATARTAELLKKLLPAATG